MAKAALNNTNIKVDYASEVMERLTREYPQLIDAVDKAVAEFSRLPEKITNKNELDLYARFQAESRVVKKTAVAYHEAEKAPYWEGGKGCDQFFFGQIDRLGKRSKGAEDGILDIADQRVDDWQQEQLRIERAKRAEEARIAQAKLQAAQAKLEAEQRARWEAEQKAARARNEANIAAHKAEAARRAAEEAKAKAEQEKAALQAEDARIDADASAADMTRTRLDGGQLATMKTVPYIRLLDRATVNLEALRHHLKPEHIEMALASWGKATGYKEPMSGAIVELREKGMIR